MERRSLPLLEEDAVTHPTIPLKLPAKGIAILFGVSEQRISQMKRKGQLTPDADGLYSVKAAREFRGMQMSEHGVRVVAQTYGNGLGGLAPAKVTPTTEAELTDDERDVLGIEVDPATVKPSPHSQFAATERLTGLRSRKLEAEALRAETRAQRERGELISRAEIDSAFASAASVVSSILQGLPAEIASIFADPEQKNEVRAKAQERVDQMQHALHSAMKDRLDGGGA